MLTARRLAPDVPISVVINPASFAGLLLAGSTHGAHLAEYLADLAASGGRVDLRERSVENEEVGLPLSAIATGLGHRIYRNGKVFGFWEPEARQLEPGDVLIEVVPRVERSQD